ncbi:UNKNOWN [Stylonychia lemnae]|uniref:VASt domain-containing protein n=1 Tax=Stylonychia lemnae TaxID=5949 RepID=A0A077ZQH6_STYLE|nr:UNKNOWN [Stylonychia lemnae]|eukprot:CDW71645.1 UNKNOWN [Stylonychia lemnae]
MLGQETKVVIQIKKIQYLKKAKSLGLLQNAIKLYLEDQKKYFFKRIKRRDQTFDMIQRLWYVESPYAKNSSLKNTFNFQPESLHRNDIDEEDELSDDPVVKFYDAEQFTKRRSMSIDESMRLTNLLPGQKTEEQQLNLLNVKSNGKKAYMGSFDPRTIRLDTNYFRSTISKNPQTSGRELFAINSPQKQADPQSMLIPVQPKIQRIITDKELDNHLSTFMPPLGHQELGRACLNISVKEFYDYFIRDNAQFAFDIYFIARGEKKINNQEWNSTIDDNFKNSFGLKPLLHKILFVEMQMKDNTFVKVSPTTKNYLLLQKEDNMLNLRIFNQMKDVPYCDYFNTEENWIITSPNSEDNSRCVIRSTFQVVFKKSTMFKGRIESNATLATKTNFTHYCSWVQEKIKAINISKNVKQVSNEINEIQNQESLYHTVEDMKIKIY